MYFVFGGRINNKVYMHKGNENINVIAPPSRTIHAETPMTL